VLGSANVETTLLLLKIAFLVLLYLFIWRIVRSAARDLRLPQESMILRPHQAQGILPVWTANLDSAYVKSRPDYQSTQEMLRQPVPPEYYHPKSNELATAFGEAVVAALYGKGQPKPLLDEAAAKMDRILKD